MNLKIYIVIFISILVFIYTIKIQKTIESFDENSNGCTTDTDCPNSYCMIDSTKNPPYSCHGESINQDNTDYSFVNSGINLNGSKIYLGNDGKESCQEFCSKQNAQCSAAQLEHSKKWIECNSIGSDMPGNYNTGESGICPESQGNCNPVNCWCKPNNAQKVKKLSASEIKSQEDCQSSGGDGYSFCPETGIHYCNNVCNEISKCGSNPQLKYNACSPTPPINSEKTCLEWGGSDYQYCSESGIHYCTGICDKQAYCGDPGKTNLRYNACSNGEDMSQSDEKIKASGKEVYDQLDYWLKNFDYKNLEYPIHPMKCITGGSPVGQSRTGDKNKIFPIMPLNQYKPINEYKTNLQANLDIAFKKNTLGNKYNCSRDKWFGGVDDTSFNFTFNNDNISSNININNDLMPTYDLNSLNEVNTFTGKQQYPPPECKFSCACNGDVIFGAYVTNNGKDYKYENICKVNPKYNELLNNIYKLQMTNAEIDIKGSQEVNKLNSEIKENIVKLIKIRENIKNILDTQYNLNPANPQTLKNEINNFNKLIPGLKRGIESNIKKLK